MMGEKLSEPYRVTEDFESYLGQFNAGDMVLKVRKMEPLSPGSSHFEFPDKVFPVFVEDIRKRNMQLHLAAVDHSRRSARVAERRMGCTLDSSGKSSGMCCLQRVS